VKIRKIRVHFAAKMVKMNPIVTSIMAVLAPLADEQRAIAMQNYMKNHFQFLGIASDNWRKPFRAFLKQASVPTHKELKIIALQFFQLPEREFHYCGIEYLAYYKKHLLPDDITFLEQLITTHSWWDSVDSISSQLIAPFFQKYPEWIAPVTEQWMNSDNIWLQRVCLIFQLSYKSKTDTALLANYCLRLAHSKEFFIAKAIGWALRQHARIDADWVQTFVATHKFQPLSKREALKHLN
jgi:3-methyladenine DNA glycosylase AlkD